MSLLVSPASSSLSRLGDEEVDIAVEEEIGAPLPSAAIEVEELPPAGDVVFYYVVNGQKYRLPEERVTDDMKQAVRDLLPEDFNYDTQSATLDLSSCQLTKWQHANGNVSALPVQQFPSSNALIQRLRKAISEKSPSHIWSDYEEGDRASKSAPLYQLPPGMKRIETKTRTVFDPDNLPQDIDIYAIDFQARTRAAGRGNLLVFDTNQLYAPELNQHIEKVFKTRYDLAFEEIQAAQGFIAQVKNRLPFPGQKQDLRQYAAHIAMLEFGHDRDLYMRACAVVANMSDYKDIEIETTRTPKEMVFIELERNRDEPAQVEKILASSAFKAIYPGASDPELQDAQERLRAVL